MMDRLCLLLFSVATFLSTFACGSFLPVEAVADTDGGIALVPAPEDLEPVDELRASKGGASVRRPTLFVPLSSSPSFVDDFDRADRVGIVGNGWFSKTESFGIFGLTARQEIGQGGGIRNVMMLRSGGGAEIEEISVTFTPLADGDDPALLVRVSSASETYDRLDGYVMQVQQARLSLRRYQLTEASTLVITALTEPLRPTRDYRLYLRARGRAPTALEGAVVDLASGEELGALFSTDDADLPPDRIGFGSTVAVHSRWDDLEVRN